MGKIIERKFGKKIYLYEVTSYWDKKNKKSKKNSIYIGKKDLKTGEIIEKKPKINPKYVTDFGCKYFFEEIINSLKLNNLINKHFNSISHLIIELVLFQAIESKPSYLMEYYYSTKEEINKYSSQRLSEFFYELGKMEINILDFTKDWIEMNKIQDSLFYDITSISSYSNLIDLVGWGYNRDKEKLPQINFGVLYGSSSKLPLLYKIYPGSINDVKTLKNIHKELKCYKLKNFTFCLDRGFYSVSNLSLIYDEDFNFIIPIPFTTKIASDFSLKNINKIDNMFHLNGDTIFCEQFETKIGKNTYFIYIYLNESRKSKELDKFSREISLIEKKIIKLDLSKTDKNLSKIKKSIGRFKKYFEISELENKFFITKKSSEMDIFVSKMGKILLISKEKYSEKMEPIISYVKRDEVEKVFDVLKNEINENRLRVTNSYTVNGRIFINFLVLICISFITKNMQITKFFKKFTINEVLLELKKLKIIYMSDGSKYLCEMTKKQEIIFDTFKISYPKA